MSERSMQDNKREEALVKKACKGDSGAQELLWVGCRRWVAAIILAHRPRNIDVEDLMQEVAVKFISKVDTLRDIRAFKPWLRQIAINACRGAARKSRPAVRISQSELIEAGEVAQPEELHERRHVGVEHRDAAAHLYERVLSLPSEYSEPLIMRCVQELSYQQISDILNLPVTTIETRLARARRMLREELDADVLKEDIS